MVEKNDFIPHLFYETSLWASVILCPLNFLDITSRKTKQDKKQSTKF